MLLSLPLSLHAVAQDETFVPVPPEQQIAVLSELAAGWSLLRETSFVGAVEILQTVVFTDGDEERKVQMSSKLHSNGESSLLCSKRVHSTEILGSNPDYLFRLKSLGESIDGPCEMMYLGVDRTVNARVDQFLSASLLLSSIAVDRLLASEGFEVLTLSQDPTGSLVRLTFRSRAQSDLFADRTVKEGWFECDRSMSGVVTAFYEVTEEGGKLWERRTQRSYSMRGAIPVLTRNHSESGFADAPPHILSTNNYTYTDEVLSAEKYRVSGYGFAEPGFGGRSGQSFWFWVVNGGFIVVALAVWLIRTARGKRKSAEPQRPTYSRE